ncbi:MAG: AEC family transporter [Clostridia bacterium]|nr:AEC family transporter [Clostridia bacterium]
MFLLMVLGFVLTHVNWINKETKPLLTNLTVTLAVPCAIFNNMLSAVNKDLLAIAGKMLIAPACTVISIYLLGTLLAKVLRMKDNRRGTFAAMCGCPNTIFVGLPVVTALFGDVGVPAAMFFFICQTTVFWSVGQSGIQADGSGHVQQKMSLVGILKKIFSLNVIIILSTVALVMLNIRVPSVITQTTKSIANLSTPMSLLFSGNAMYEIYKQFGLRGLMIRRDEALVILTRFLIAPAAAFGFCLLFGIGGIERSVFILMASMPTMTQTVILSGKYGADRDFAAITFFWTTCFTMIVIPVLMSILG